MKTKKQINEKTETEIPTIDGVQLDNVSGGCAACGMANCTMTNASGARTWFRPAFRR